MSFDREFNERVLGGPMTEIGSDVAIRWHVGEDGVRRLYWSHPCGEVPAALGHITFRQDNPEARGWDLISEEPLNVGGSLLCGTCHKHGFIIGGKWIPA